jgi:hypothetical protein
MHTTEELKENIQREIFSISQEKLHRVNVKCLRRCQKYVQNNEDHFQLMV